MPGDFSQVRGEANDKFADGADDRFMVAILVVIEPDPVVVVSKVFEKCKKILGKTIEFRHRDPGGCRVDINVYYAELL